MILTYNRHTENTSLPTGIPVHGPTFLAAMMRSWWVVAWCMLTMCAHADTSRLYTADQMSSSMTVCICQDRTGYLWVGTEYGLNKFDGYRFTTFFADAADSTSLPDNEVTNFLTDRNGRLWIGFSKGLAHYDAEHNSFVRHRFPGGLRPRVESMVEDADGNIIIGTAGYGVFALRHKADTISREQALRQRAIDDFANKLFIDDQHNLWRCCHLPVITRTKMSGLAPTATKDFNSNYGPGISFIKTDKRGFLLICMYGIMRYDYLTGTLSDAGYDLSALDGSVSIRNATLDHQGNLFLGTSGNGLMVVPAGSKVLRKVESASNGFDLGSANVNDIMVDKHHNLWVSCYKKGLFRLNQGQDAFHSWSFSRQNYQLGSSVSSITPGNDGAVWCTVQKSGVYLFDAQGRIAAHPAAPSGANTIYRDRQGHFWLCTENALYSYNPLAGSAQERLRLDGWGLNCMTDDGEGTLYICNYGKGLVIYNTATGQYTMKSMSMADQKKGRLCNDWIKTLCIDSRGLLWIGCADGLSVMNPADGNFRVMGWEVQLAGLQCLAFSEKPNGDMLIGTNNGLYLYDRKKGATEAVAHTDELRNKAIYGIATDAQGDVWMSTSMGIWQLEKASGRLIGHLHGNGLTTKEYIIGAMLQANDSSGRIVFGTNDGMTTFLPRDVRASRMQMGEIFLTAFSINGKAANPQQERFEIPYDENSFTMEFSLLTFRNTDNITFQYRINGGNWTSVPEGQNAVSFARMKPGRYIIEVRAMSNGVYSESVKTITVVVRDPWYSSSLAYLLYALLAAGLIFMALMFYERRKKAEMEEAKMRFLINATHDIRSPLTLIMGPVQKLKDMLHEGKDPMRNLKGDNTLHTEISNELETIDRNAQRLMLLVNQILDERKIDKNQMHLHCQETNLVEFIGGICTLYQYNASQRNIHFHFEHADKKVVAWIDRVNFDKAVSNLLSNAFKYTFDGGDICIDVAQTSKEAIMKVTDTGIGFKDEKTDKLFERFYQGANSRDVHIEGTGIGLNLSRAITQMHGGSIKAYNRTDGQRGACLEVRIPLGNAHLKPEEILNDEKETSSAPKEKKQASKNFKILLVDDDNDLAQYIRNELSSWYRFDIAPNGKEALKSLLTGSYDLVVSDVMMPEMDGITLLKNIKGNSNISDIPVILLTSKAEVSDRLEGLKRGADAFLAKPFNMAELHILIDNLIDNVRRLRGKFSGAQVQEQRMEPVEVKGNNDALMDRIMHSINEHLSDPDFNVERLTEDVGISRAQLHRKMKEITGISTAEFIRNLRLEQAARLIREDKINITQVAYSVGFNNQTHFSTVFKKHYGMTPTEYSEANKTNNNT